MTGVFAILLLRWLPDFSAPQETYADGLTALSPAARLRDGPEQPRYSYCVRNTATYECLSYGSDGNVRRVRREVTAHGTAFGYAHDGASTLLLTNQHVAEWPGVTSEDHEAADVPMGCKRIVDSLKIVDGENDDYERDDIPLTRVVADPQLDIAVLRARKTLEVLPWRIGKSAALRERNVVEVKGYPLGAFAATNIGKVISAYDHDTYRDWDHDDFVVDALLSAGNSGSPVLAVSVATGELELVGVYHAAYSAGSAMNVVIGIDQVRELMTTLQRSPRSRGEDGVALDADARPAFVARARASLVPFFAVGPLVGSVRATDDGRLLFTVFSNEFPTQDRPVVVVEDVPEAKPGSFGSIGAVFFGNKRGLKRYARADLEADAQAQVARLLEVLRRDLMIQLDFRDAAGQASASREASERAARLERDARRSLRQQREMAQTLAELADRLGPEVGDEAETLADAFAVGATTASASPAVRAGVRAVGPPP